jgi:hypothetical protein
MEQDKSLVWLVNLGNSLSGNSNKYSKQKIGEYTPGDDKFLFPIGIVLQHSSNTVYEDFGGFDKGTNLVARKLYDTVDVGHLEGELLTIADASFTDKQQREAFKSLIRQTLWKFNHQQERKVTEIFKSA